MRTCRAETDGFAVRARGRARKPMCAGLDARTGRGDKPMRAGQSMRARTDLTPQTFVFAGLTRRELGAMYACAAEAVAALADMAGRGRNPVTEVLGGADRIEEWAHLPDGDMVDPETRCRFYYHAHSAAERAPGEHGHFHVFVSLQPTETGIAHLVAIAVDPEGRLLRLFTTNRWVTGEAWRSADDMAAHAERFAMRAEAPSPALGRWIEGVVGMFRPQIAALLRERDARVAQFADEHPEGDALENRALQITSEMAVDFPDHIRAIEAAITA